MGPRIARETRERVYKHCFGNNLLVQIRDPVRASGGRIVGHVESRCLIYEVYC